MHEREERVTVVETGGGSGGVIAGIVGAVVAVLIIVWLFGAGIFGGGNPTIDVNVDVPAVTAPAGD